MNSDTAIFWDGFIGNEASVRELSEAASSDVSSYLLTAPYSALDAALRLAAQVISRGATDSERLFRLVRERKHPDVLVISPEGVTLRVSDVADAVDAAMTTPVETERKVVVIESIDQIESNAIGKLLKTVEEPPPSVVFVLVGSSTPPEIATIVSRCLTIRFSPLPDKQIEKLVLEAGHSPAVARSVAVASGGDPYRALVLAQDPNMESRASMWTSVPEVVSTTGASICERVSQILESVEAVNHKMTEAHQEELAELDELAERFGERGLGRSALLAHQKRQLRKNESDELRFGLALLSRCYFERFFNGDSKAQKQIGLIQRAAEAMDYNPNQRLLLTDLLLQLGAC